MGKRNHVWTADTTAPLFLEVKERIPSEGRVRTKKIRLRDVTVDELITLMQVHCGVDLSVSEAEALLNNKQIPVKGPSYGLEPESDWRGRVYRAIMAREP
jgi:hypothetical protein